ncbi:hypothetical protein GCM10018775_35540 [Streptomyces umbrinus]|nr:hypothetical protein GCM10018775_35540 [Streptomyces umbrinus]
MDVADAVLAHGDADAQVHEQAGEPAARRDPNRCHRDEQNERAYEQELVEVVDSQRLFPSRRSGWITLTSWTASIGWITLSGATVAVQPARRFNYFVTLPNS